MTILGRKAKASGPKDERFRWGRRRVGGYVGRRRSGLDRKGSVGVGGDPLAEVTAGIPSFGPSLDSGALGKGNFSCLVHRWAESHAEATRAARSER
jgi:hypothetical protein